MSKVQWLGDAISDCKSDLTKQAACHSFAATLSTATGSGPLGTYYKDKCLDYLCATGSMPTAKDIQPCQQDQSNRDKCAAFGSALAAATGSAPLGPFYRDQCLDYLCANGKMPTKQDLPPLPPLAQLYPWGVEAPETKSLQEELNKKLVADGLCALKVDRKLGAATCGAAVKYGVPVPSCAGHPTTAPVPCGAKPKPSPSTPVVGAGAAPTGVSWGWIIAGVVGIGVVAYLARGGLATGPASNPSEPRPKFKIHLERVRLDRGGYETSGYHRGRYWGVGEPLYRYSDDSGAIDGYVRAANRAQAKEKVVYRSPGIDISFYRA